MRTSLGRLLARPAILVHHSSVATRSIIHVRHISETSITRASASRASNSRTAQLAGTKAQLNEETTNNHQSHTDTPNSSTHHTNNETTPQNSGEFARQSEPKTPLRSLSRRKSLSVESESKKNGRLPFIDNTGSDPQVANDVQEAGLETDAWGRSPQIWLSLLEEESRTKGHEGIEQVWTLMKEASVQLPVDSKVGKRLWVNLLNNPKLHDELILYAIELRQQTGKAYGNLYERIMRSVVHSGSLEKTLAKHRQLLKNYMVPRDALKNLAGPMVNSTKIYSLEAFRTIYKDLHNQSEPIYDHLILALVQAKKFREALLWHTTLQSNNDYPSAEAVKNGMVQAFQEFRESVRAKKGWRSRRVRAMRLEHAATVGNGLTAAGGPLDSSHLEVQIATHGLQSPVLDTPIADEALRERIASLPTPPASKRGLFSSVLAEMRNPGGDRFSDEFCARLYATKALTPSWVTSFLHAFTVKEIGPIALRELALRCESTEVLQYHIAELDDSGIFTGSSTFCRALKRFADEGQVAMLQGLIYSDQHPDDLHDVGIQRRILDKAVERGDWMTAHRTLTLQSMFSPDPKQAYMNDHLCSHMRLRRINDVLTLAEKMHAEGVKITPKTLTVAMWNLMRERRPGRRPNMFDARVDYDDLALVTNLALRAIEAGTAIPTWVWVELQKRHGMKNMDSLANFCHATINAYLTLRARVTQQGAELVGHGSLWPPSQLPLNEYTMRTSLPSSAQANPMHSLFTATLSNSIVELGFRDGLRQLTNIREKYLGRTPRSSRLKPSSLRSRIWPVGLTPPPPRNTFLRGLDVLQSLRAKGIQPNEDGIERIVRMRLWVLFGPGRSYRKANVLSMALNPYGIIEMLDAIDEMWTGTPLFPEVRELLRLLRVRSSLQSSSTTGGEGGRPLDHHVDSSELSTFPPPSKKQIREKEELELKVHTMVLMTLFKDMRTVGYKQKRHERLMLSEQQWEEFLYAWARSTLLRHRKG